MSNSSKTSAAQKTVTGKTSSSTAGAYNDALFASIGEGIITTDEAGLITRVNQAALDMLGYTQTDLTGQRFLDKIVSLHDNGTVIGRYDQPITKAFQTGGNVRSRTLYKRKDGTLLPAQVTVAPIILKGHPVGAVEVFRDLTEEMEGDKLKSDFISIASHQLRTPLSAINMYTRMLHDGLAGDVSQDQLPYLQTILKSVERMNTLIDTLLNITRIEAGGVTVRLGDVRLDTLATEITTEFIPAAKIKHITVRSDIPTMPLNLRTDSLLVKEVCANLLSNAIKYTPEGGTVWFTLADRGTEVRLSVRDNGYGIPETAQKNIFMKFFRAENITRKDVSGTGLGLYLVRHIAESLGGDLWFESTEDQGSCFYFTLPKL